ncbi:MAG: hypothetical protein K2X87_18990 [Gemmataceae bacterium]|nr:hypothetical protein [Gemmataceae bacterium]
MFLLLLVVGLCLTFYTSTGPASAQGVPVTFPDQECRQQVCNKLKLTVIGTCQCDFTNATLTFNWCFDSTKTCDVPNNKDWGYCDGECKNISKLPCTSGRLKCTLPLPPPPP